MIVDEFLFGETFFTSEKFPYGTFRTYPSKSRFEGSFYGALPQTPLENFLKEVFKNFKNFY